MRKSVWLICLGLVYCNLISAQWKPAGDKIKTAWGEQLDAENVLPEYPRPIMERPEWKNLNGSWDYAITKKVFLPRMCTKVKPPCLEWGKQWGRIRNCGISVRLIFPLRGVTGRFCYILAV